MAINATIFDSIKLSDEEYIKEMFASISKILKTEEEINYVCFHSEKNPFFQFECLSSFITFKSAPARNRFRLIVDYCGEFNAVDILRCLREFFNIKRGKKRSIGRLNGHRKRIKNT